MNSPRSEDRFPWTRISNLALGVTVLFSAMALARYRTWHNETFDLAFYTRLVWGAGRLDLSNPLVGTSLWGLHLSLILFPLGLLGRIVPIVPLLLVVQAACVCAAGIPLARIAHRRIGHPYAPYLTLAVYFLLPVIGSVCTYEFHPSSLALLPLALALDWFDRGDVTPGAIALLVAATCREDVALVAGLTGLSLAVKKPHRRAGLGLFAFFTAWFVAYIFFIAPKYLPRVGSLQLHYGHLGRSPTEILTHLVAHPVATLREIFTPARALYLPRMLVPVAFLPLLRPRWLLPVAAPLAINLLSQFPTAVQVHSHYATLMAPFLIVAAVHGMAQVMVAGALHAERWALAATFAVLVGTAHMQHRAGVLPLVGGRFDRHAFVSDSRAEALDAVVNIIPADAAVAGPDYLLPHVAERRRLFRYPTERRPEYIVLATDHRARFAGTQELWRNIEERTVRNAIYWRRYGVWAVVGDFVILRDGWPVRTHARGRYVSFTPDPRAHASHRDIGDSLALAGWGMSPVERGTRLTLLIVAKRKLPFDLGLEVGWGPMRPHLDREDPAHTYAFLPFDGVFMPPFVRIGEVARTTVDVPATMDELRAHGVYFGARRIDGSRLDPDSPHWTLLPPANP